MDTYGIKITNKYETQDFYYHESDDIQLSKDDHVAHSHKHYEILQVVKGNITCIIDSKIYNMSDGDVCLIRPLDFHIIKVHGDTYIRRVVEFTPQALMMIDSARDLLLHPFRSGRKKFNNYIPSNSLLQSNFNTIVNEIADESNNPTSDIQDVKLGILLSKLLLSLHPFSIEGANTDDYKNNVCHMIIDYINKHIGEKITLSDMEKELNLSKYYMSHEFSKQMGMTIAKFIIEKKMLYAEQLIESGMSPTEASDIVAYNYPNFYTNYKKVFGKSPKQTTRK